MDPQGAERQFQRLRKLYERGELDEQAFRFEIAKLMLRDGQGAFWMVGPEGTWYRNQGSGWVEADPEKDYREGPDVGSSRRRPHRSWAARALGLAVFFVMVTLGVLAWQRWPAVPWGAPSPTAASDSTVVVTLSSPAEGAVVAVGQEVGVESMLRAEPDLRRVDRVDLRVRGQIVGSQPVGSRVEAGQTSLPLSLPWRPTAVGEYELTVAVLSTTGERLGEDTITLFVAEAPGETLPEPNCTPDAAFLSHVTIPPGSTFPPEARMEKIWQVRNSGTCAWGVGYDLVRVAGAQLGAEEVVPAPTAVAGERLNLEITFQAPEATGSYTSAWQLRDPEGMFFGPTLMLAISVEAQAAETQPPTPPEDVQAIVIEGGNGVQLTWVDRSDDEDAFRIYRDDVEASIGLVPADTEVFVDRSVACGNTYRYSVVAFNAAGASAPEEAQPVTMPPCARATLLSSPSP
jgi:hypothetical protein